MTFNYGFWAAKKRKKKKLENKKEVKKKTIKKDKVKKVPTLELNPLENVKLEKKYIDWENKTTKEGAIYLNEELKDKYFKLLQMPTGTGKTSVGVYTMGEIQKRIENPMFVVLASRAIVDDKGWNKTILEYNEYFKDNQIKPYTIDTYERFANVIADNRSLKNFIKDVGDKKLFIIIDEVHNYKNPTSKRSKTMQKLTFAKKLGLSATPLTNDIVLDGCSYLVLGQYFRNKTNFLKETKLIDKMGKFGQFLIYDSKGRVDENSWKFYPRFKELLSEIFYKPDISIKDIDMPDITNNYIQLDKSDDLNSDIKSLVSAYRKRAFDSVIDYLFEVYERIYTDEIRINKLLEILDNKDIIQPLIFYQNVAIGDRLYEKITKKGFEVGRVDGSHSIKDVDKEKNYPILIQYQSGSAGVEFKKSNASIFYQNQPSYTNLVQARGRNQRRGMSHDINHYYLIADNYFDQTIFERVSNMEELNDEVLIEILEEGD